MSDYQVLFQMQIVAIDDKGKPDTEYVTGYGDVPRLKDVTLIGEPVLLFATRFKNGPGWKPHSHIIQLKDGRLFVCDDDQVGAL